MKRIFVSLLALAIAALTATGAFAQGLDEVPNDPLFNEQWYLQATNAPAIWENRITGEGVRIGVLDTGIYFDHEDFDNDFVDAGHNYLGNYYHGSEYISYDDTRDFGGHGTRVSSIICAERNNGVGIAGMLCKATIVPLKIHGEGAVSSRGNDINNVANTVQAIKEAVDIYDCDVLNMSFGLSVYTDDEKKTVKQAIDYAASKGVIIVAGVGNSGDETLNFPAGFDNVIGVGAVDKDGSVANYSNHNQSVFVTAPGTKIMTASNESPDTYSLHSGTSFSSPQVAALAGAAKSVEPDLTVDEFKQLLKATSVDAGESGWDEYYGWGVIDCKAFLNVLKQGNEVAGFYDISDHWARQSIEYVVGQSLFDGVSEHAFAPDREMTRAMLVTVLGRLFENSGSLAIFADADSISQWSRDAMVWAVEKDLINGVEADGNMCLMPGSGATRAQVAAIVERYCGVYLSTN